MKNNASDYWGFEPDTGKFVCRVLTMLRFYDRNRAELTDFERDSVPPADLLWEGFDARETGQHHDFAVREIGEPGSWREREGSDLNSQNALSVQKYEAMLAVWDGLDRSRGLTLAELLSVASAGDPYALPERQTTSWHVLG